MAQLAPGSIGSGVQLPLAEKSFSSVPPTPTLRNVTAFVPRLVAVTTCDLLFVPTFWLPYSRLVGESSIAVALPDSSTNCGFEDALSLIVINPVGVPAAFGLNSALSEQVAPAASELPHVVLMVNGPVTFIEPIDRKVFP